MKQIITILLVCLIATISNAQSLSLNQNTKSKNTKGEVQEDDTKFHFYSITSLNTTEELVNSITGSQKFAILINVLKTKELDEQKIQLKNINLFVSANVLNLKPTGVNKDSVDLVSFNFPETGNAGFLIAPQVNWYEKNGHTLSSEGSFSLRQNKINSFLADSNYETINFSLLNFNLCPIRYMYDYENGDFKGSVSIAPYINILNIPNEDALNFNKLFNYKMFESSKKSNIKSLGCKFQLNLNNFIFFLDGRHNFVNHLNIPDDNPLKGFVFNAGFTTAVNIFSR